MEAKLTRDAAGDYCPVRATLALVGQKWVPRIIYELLPGKARFNELASAVGGCNSRTLRDRLIALEEHGIVHRELVTTTPPWVEYELTACGRELAESFESLASWGRTHLSSEDLSSEDVRHGLEAGAAASVPAAQ